MQDRHRREEATNSGRTPRVGKTRIILLISHAVGFLGDEGEKGVSLPDEADSGAPATYPPGGPNASKPALQHGLCEHPLRKPPKAFTDVERPSVLSRRATIGSSRA